MQNYVKKTIYLKAVYPSLDITQLILDQLKLEYEADLRERSLR